ncbi:MAG: hypothetical protein KDA83_11070 [Planctomycetales bacterium]|nr:hypothetical protein [Planctomycetales bacterium]
MIDFAYLNRGLTGLAQAHRAGTMAGHLGAALVAGYLYGEDEPDLPAEVHRGIEGELDRVVAGEEAIWFNARQAGVMPQELFEPLEHATGDRERVTLIAEALAESVGELRQSGHNVIFAALAIRGLTGHEDFATQPIVDGIVRLISGFKNQHGGRGYFGAETGWKTNRDREPDAASDFPAYDSVQAMVDRTIDTVIGTAHIKRQGFGGLWHLINHAAGIVELDACGFRLLARQALPAHHTHLRYWNSLPDVAEELGEQLKAPADPRTAEYWAGMLKRDEARLTHRVKTLYGFRILERLIDDEDRRQAARDALLYLMA